MVQKQARRSIDICNGVSRNIEALQHECVQRITTSHRQVERISGVDDQRSPGKVVAEPGAILSGQVKNVGAAPG